MTDRNHRFRVPNLAGSLGHYTRRDHKIAGAWFAILDRARLPVMSCLPSGQSATPRGIAERR